MLNVFTIKIAFLINYFILELADTRFFKTGSKYGYSTSFCVLAASTEY